MFSSQITLKKEKNDIKQYNKILIILQYSKTEHN